MQAARKATIYRMVTPEHTCPYGLNGRDPAVPTRSATIHGRFAGPELCPRP
jgi:hypothetical protein